MNYCRNVLKCLLQNVPVHHQLVLNTMACCEKFSYVVTDKVMWFPKICTRWVLSSHKQLLPHWVKGEREVILCIGSRTYLVWKDSFPIRTQRAFKGLPSSRKKYVMRVGVEIWRRKLSTYESLVKKINPIILVCITKVQYTLVPWDNTTQAYSTPLFLFYWLGRIISFHWCIPWSIR